MIRSTSYLKKLRPKTELIGKEHDVSPEEIEDMFDHFLQTLKEMIGDPRMPKIKISNWGTYQPSIGKINWQIRRKFYDYRNGSITRDQLRQRISELWPVKQRLIKEKLGHETWPEWRYKELTPYAKTEDKTT